MNPQPTWLKILAWSQLVSGIVGFLMLPFPDTQDSRPLAALPALEALLAVAFFGAAIVAGTLIFMKREAGITWSVPVQAAQLLVINVGWLYGLQAGPYVLAVIGSTGLGVWFGAGARFAAQNSALGVLAGRGTGGSLYLGFFAHPLQSTSFLL